MITNTGPPTIGKGATSTEGVAPFAFGTQVTIASDFCIHVELDAFEKADDENPMRIGGIVSTDQLDKDGERIIQEGLDFSPFLREGWFNDNHSPSMTDIVGYPTDARFVRKGEGLPNGKIAQTNGWWAEGYLMNTAKGREIWALTQSLRKSKRKLGFSIEGKVLQRKASNKTIVTKGVVKHVAVTHCPKNTGTELDALSKALMAGGSIVNPGTSPGEGFPLRAESLEGGRAADDETRDDELMTGHELLDDSPEAIGKAEPFELESISDIDAIAAWAPAVAASLADTKARSLTKAEARIMVRAMRPGLTSEQVDAIVDRASNGG